MPNQKPQFTREFIQKFSKGLTSEPLKPYTTFKIGGPADYFYRITDENDVKALPNLIKFAQKNSISYLIIGASSNVLFDDEGFRGLIVKMEYDEVKIIEENEKNDQNTIQITATAGTLVSKLVKFAITHNLSPLEKWAALPGTIGGAVYGNAGCNGLETADILISAQILDPKTGKIAKKETKDLEFRYRHSILKETKEIVISATFALKKDVETSENQQKALEEAHKWRAEHQPIGFTTGSFFKNPSPEDFPSCDSATSKVCPGPSAPTPGTSAGALIDQAGLKGKTIGQAQISPKHANFFINLGQATSTDMLSLARLAKQQVQAEFGITLRPEVQIVSPQGNPISL